MSQQFSRRKTNRSNQRKGRAETNRTCTECETGSLRRPVDETSVFCENCGLVVEETKVTLEPRRQRGRKAERQQSCVNAPLTRRYGGLMTMIGWRDIDAQRTILAPRKRHRMRRLRYWQEQFQLMDGSNRQFALEITRLSEDTRYCRSEVVASH